MVPFPWDGLNKLCTGMMTSYMDVYKAPPKVGKTTLMGEIIMHIEEVSDHNIGVIWLESTAKEIGLKLTGIKHGKPLDHPSCEVNPEEYKEDFQSIAENEQLHIFDPADERTAENIFKKIRHFAKAEDCKFIFLDHASMLAYGEVNVDERKFLDKLFKDLKDLTLSLDIYIGVIIHVNDDGTTRGSRAPIQLCNRLIGLQRDKLSENEAVKNTTHVIVEENRYGGCGEACQLFYDKESGRMKEVDEDFIIEQQNADLREVKFDD